MATIYKRGDIWWARFFDADGKRVSHSTGKTRKREAEAEAARLEVESKNDSGKSAGLPKAFAVIVETATREAASGDFTLARAEELIKRLHQLANPDFEIISLADHLTAWVSDQKDITDSTSGIYWDMHRRVIEHLGVKVASAPVGDLSVEQVKKCLQKIKATGLKSSTVNMDLRALRRALHTAVKAGLAKINVASDIKPMSEDDSIERAPFTAHEVRMMIDHDKTSEEWKGVILIAAHTGLRLGDVVKLSRAHIDGTKIVIRPTKTAKQKKTISIPLSPPCIAWIADRKGLFFPHLSTLAPGTLSTTFTRIMSSSGVARDIVLPGGIAARRSFHCLRHSFTSWLAAADVHADIRQKLTGHSSSRIHALYTHHDEALDRAVATLPSFTA
jgi:integrase